MNRNETDQIFKFQSSIKSSKLVKKYVKVVLFLKNDRYCNSFHQLSSLYYAVQYFIEFVLHIFAIFFFWDKAAYNNYFEYLAMQILQILSLENKKALVLYFVMYHKTYSIFMFSIGGATIEQCCINFLQVSIIWPSYLL